MYEMGSLFIVYTCIHVQGEGPNTVAIRDWYDTPDSLISSSELSDDSVS